MRQTSKITSFILVIGFLLASCAPGSTAYAANSSGAQSTAAPSAQPTEQRATQSAQDNTNVVAVTGNDPNAAPSSEAVAAVEGVYEKAYQQVNPSVVNIQVTQSVAANSLPGFDFFGQQGNTPQQQGPQVQRGLGSGFVWDTNGYIVTNNHVVEGADKVTVTFYDGTTLPAKVIGTDLNSDLAVVQVQAPANLLKPVTLANSNEVKVGQMAIAIGNPFGLEGSMTVGIVSAIGRSLPVNINAGVTSPSYTIPDIIQTDAPINPGNSGGVLVNAGGQVIGVTSAIESQSGSNAGIGFAIPADMVKNVIPALIKDGKYEYTWLGISGTTLTPDMAKAMNLDQNQRGILVGDVTSGSPADKAGIKASNKQVTIDGLQGRVGGDVITQIDNQKLNRFEDMVSFLARSTKVGQKVTLTILRDDKEQTVDVTLEARPAEQPVSSAPSAPGILPGNPGSGNPQSPNLPQNHPPIGGAAYLGITGTDVTPDVAQQLNLDSSVKGVLVMSVADGSPAADAGLVASTQNKAGDIITGIDGQSITGFNELRDLLSQKQAGDKVTLQILRDGKQTSVDVTLGSR